MKKKFYKKSKPKEQKFPNNYRTIPERLKGDGFVFLVGLMFIASAIFVVSFDLYINYKRQEELIIQKTKIERDLVFWEREVKKRPDYRDGYFTLALLNYQLRNFNEVSKNLMISLDLDPNFKKGREFEEIFTLGVSP